MPWNRPRVRRDWAGSRAAGWPRALCLSVVAACGPLTVGVEPLDAGGEAPPLDAELAPDADTPDAPASDASASEPRPALTADDVWTPLSVMSVVDPLDYGARGDGVHDDLPALEASINALPAGGGIVRLAAGKSFRKRSVLAIEKSHVKFWGFNGAGELLQTIEGQRLQQATLCRGNTGCGLFGVKLRSDADVRFDALEDHQIVADHAALIEVVGCELEASAATGIFLYGSREHYLEGNYLHDTSGGNVHHTEGASAAWVWNNFFSNRLPGRGDDAIACVTYGPASERCRDMEWWNNAIVHSRHGRGYSVVGGNDISIHDNWAVRVAAAAVSVASEASFNTSASRSIRIFRNYLVEGGFDSTHPAILISGLNPAAGPLRDIALQDNVAVDASNGGYRSEGEYEEVHNQNLQTTATALPAPAPTAADIHTRDTSVLCSRDVSHVAAESQPGLYRIHVRENPAERGYQQRFEYVLRGPKAALEAYVNERGAAGDYLSELRSVGGMSYALLLCRSPRSLPNGLGGVSFRELRSGDLDGSLSWLWRRLDRRDY